MPYTNKNPDSETISHKSVSNYSLSIPYFAPYIAYVCILSLFSGISTEWRYSLAIVVVAAILIGFRHRYGSLTGPGSTFLSVVWGLVFGLFGLVIWILLLRPFVDTKADAWAPAAFYLRLFAASIVVPIFEELLMRGYIFRFTYQWNRQRMTHKKGAFDRALNDDCINHFQPGAWSVPAVLVSTVAFMLGHQIHEWPAAFVYGLLMVLLWIKRKDLMACVVAHGTTNFALGLYVFYTKQWQLW
jgi:hypothetical protein